MYLSTAEHYRTFDARDLVWQQRDIVFGDWGLSGQGDERHVLVNVSIPEARRAAMAT